MKHEQKNKKKYRILVVDDHDWADRESENQLRNWPLEKEPLTKYLEEYATHLDIRTYESLEDAFGRRGDILRTEPENKLYDVLLTNLYFKETRRRYERDEDGFPMSTDMDGWPLDHHSRGYDLIFEAARLGVPLIGCWINSHPLESVGGLYDNSDTGKAIEKFTINRSVLTFCHWKSFPKLWCPDGETLILETTGCDIYTQVKKMGKGNVLACRDLVKNWPALLNELVNGVDGPLPLENMERHLTKT